MESIKRKWGKPEVGVQLFMPNEYCVPCGDGTTMVTYEFWCNAGTGDYYVWEETNGITGLQTSDGYEYNADGLVIMVRGEVITHVMLLIQ